MTFPRSLAPALILSAVLLLLPAGRAPAAGDETPAAARARDLGARAAQALQRQLGGALMQAMRDGGPAAAVAVCADTARALTARVARDMEVPGLELGRTSLNLRNPANRPDSLETAVLEDFATALAGDAEPAPRLVREGGDWRFFTPIVTRDFCLQCHGPAERLAEGVPEILAARYPDDAATGHAAGDLRGIVSVTIPAKAAAE